MIDEGFQLHQPSVDYLDGLRAANCSVNTERSYASRVALYLSYTVARGIDWKAPTLQNLAAYLRWLVDEPLSPRGRHPGPEPKHRQSATANAHLGTVCEFLRWSSLRGLVSSSVINILAQPKYLAYLPDGFDPGEDGQNRTIRSRAIKLSVAVPGFAWLTYEHIDQMLAVTRHARDRFLLIILRDTGIRIGEALGLRREDMHLLPNSTAFGCAVIGPHIHVIRRSANRNRALAKSRKPRWIPVDPDTAGAYADYQYERDEIPQAAGSDMVFVNLFASPLGEAMKYPSTYELFKRIAKKASLDAHPHMVRHGTITRWIKDGMQRDTAQDFSGHASEYSMKPYVHITGREMREHAQRVNEIQKARKSK
ncbi:MULTISPECIES: tyrosine-type recombinase/integrase [unclassified Streptomyces]|uniref:tyrosine-type recombinase/integrase n=1 Tax=unclassified Streptomyces TaxID=2593676 RepID=UPI0027E567AE|nr:MULTISPECIES: tyrosine-type recombinase/integrase [unclassified Streptomyces]